jgi:hypothetical protein
VASAVLATLAARVRRWTPTLAPDALAALSAMVARWPVELEAVLSRAFLLAGAVEGSMRIPELASVSSAGGRTPVVIAPDARASARVPLASWPTSCAIPW